MTSMPQGAQRSRQVSMSLLAAAVLLSLLLHGALAALCLLAPKESSEQEQSILIQLISHQLLTQQEPQPEKESRGTAPEKDSPGLSPRGRNEAAKDGKGRMIRLESKTAATPILEPVQDAATRKALKRIQKKITPHWKRADPPGMGLVEVRMELDGQGGIRSLWITSLQGPPELGDFIAGLIRRSSPFPEAVSHLSGRSMVLDCSFNVTGSTVKTTAASQGGG